MGTWVLINAHWYYVFYDFWFISVWCFFAAILSIIVLLHFRRVEPEPLSLSR